jgi:hypothetical protein
MLVLPHDFEPQAATAQHQYAEQGAAIFSKRLPDAFFIPALKALAQRVTLLEKQFLPKSHGNCLDTHDLIQDDLILDDLITDLSQRIIRLESEHPGSQGMLYESVALSPELLSLASHPQLTEMAQFLLNSDTIGCHPRTLVLMGLPHQTWHLGHWHQDWHYNRGPFSTVTFYIPLHTVTSTNGSLLLALEEHQKGPLPHENGNSEQKAIQTKWETLPDNITSAFGNVMSTELHRGDILCFNSLTPHSAQVNQSNQIRFVLNFRYTDLTDPDYLAKGWHDPTPAEIHAQMRRKGP